MGSGATGYDHDDDNDDDDNGDNNDEGYCDGSQSDDKE